MADNVTFQAVTLATAPDATVVATDDCAGAQVQLFKQAISAGGDGTLIPATAADGLLVNLGSNNDVTIASGSVTAVVSGTVAVSAVVPGTGATNLGKAEDAAHTSGDVGVMALGIRQDADAAVAGDGDYAPLQTDADGYLKVNVKAGSGGGGTQYAQGTAGTATDQVTMAGAVRKDTAAVDAGVADGDRLVLSSDSVGRLRVTAADTTQPISGTVAATQSGTWNITNVSGTVSLPTGAATEATLSTLNGKVTACNTGAVVIASGAVTVSGTVAATQSGTWTVQPGNTANYTAWLVTGTGGTFPVTGTFWQATQPVSAAALPLPSGASTLAEQQTQTTSLQLIDDAITTTGSAVTAKGILATGTDGTNARGLKTDSSGELQIDVLTSALPSGAATETTLATLKAAMTVTALQVTASGDTTLIASGTRKIHRVEMSNSHATAAVVAGLKIASVNSGAVFSKKYLPPVGGTAVVQIENGYIQATSEVIAVNLSGAGQVEVTIYYE